jgi:hypothetical protein
MAFVNFTGAIMNPYPHQGVIMENMVAIQITNETVPMILAVIAVDDRNDFLEAAAELNFSESTHYYVGSSLPLTEPLDTTTQIMPEYILNEIYFVPPSAPDNAWFSVTRY